MLRNVLNGFNVQLVKDIRRLVDSGEFLANRHCKSSPVVKLIITLLLELITDHSREVSLGPRESCTVWHLCVGDIGSLHDTRSFDASADDIATFKKPIVCPHLIRCGQLV